MVRDTDKRRVLATNRKAKHEYSVLEELECGIQLVGTEVKALRQGRCSIAEAFGRIDGGELYIHGMTIPEYSHGTHENHEPDRRRKLLAHRRELRKWERQVKLRGVTIIPLEVLFAGHLVKVKMALAQGKRSYDKRASEREKDDRREMRRLQGDGGGGRRRR